MQLAFVIAISRGRLPTNLENRITAFFGVMFLIGQFFSYLQNIRRYAVGLSGTWFSYRDAAWSPPYFGWWLPMFILMIGLASASWMVIASHRETQRAL